MKILASSLLFSLCSIAALGKSVDQHFEDAKRLLVQGDHSDALQSLELAVSIDPSNYLSRFKRAGLVIFKNSVVTLSNAAEYGQEPGCKG